MIDFFPRSREIVSKTVSDRIDFLVREEKWVAKKVSDALEFLLLFPFSRFCFFFGGGPFREAS